MSKGRLRKIFGFEAYHWAILIKPDGEGQEHCCVYDATDTSTIDPQTMRMINPTMDWWFRPRINVDPIPDSKILGCLAIGRLSDNVTVHELTTFFQAVPLPVKNTNPQQSCVTWVVDAIQQLQDKGWVEEFPLDSFKEEVLKYANGRLDEEASPLHVEYYKVNASE